MNRQHCLLLIVGLLISSCGATCGRRPALKEFAPQPVWSTRPSLQQVMEVVNRSHSIQELQSNNVTVKVENQGVPTLSGTLQIERPKKLRLKAGLSRLMGDEVDVGSNDYVFWLQTMRPSPTLYFAEHERFDNQAQRHFLPVSPLWIMDALGLVELDPQYSHEEPFMRPDGKIEIRSMIPTPTGSYRRVMILEPKYAYIEQLWLYDPQGGLVATAEQSEHQFYPAIKMSLPHKVRLRLMPPGEQEIAMVLSIGFYLVNESIGNDPNRWVMPDTSSSTSINLVDYNAGLQAAVVPPAYQAEPVFRQATPNYRGFERR